MSISVSLVVTPAAPARGDTVTATYSVLGNDPTAPEASTVAGSATVGGIDYDVTTTITKPGSPALSETFRAPTLAGWTFTQAEGNPRVWTALVP